MRWPCPDPDSKRARPESGNWRKRPMPTIDELVKEWRAMKIRLEYQLSMIDDEFHKAHGPVPRETIRRWIVELDDLIIKYAFEI
jgi:hypothetical protein